MIVDDVLTSVGIDPSEVWEIMPGVRALKQVHRDAFISGITQSAAGRIYERWLDRGLMVSECVWRDSGKGGNNPHSFAVVFHRGPTSNLDETDGHVFDPASLLSFHGAEREIETLDIVYSPASGLFSSTLYGSSSGAEGVEWLHVSLPLGVDTYPGRAEQAVATYSPVRAIIPRWNGKSLGARILFTDWNQGVIDLSDYPGNCNVDTYAYWERRGTRSLTANFDIDYGALTSYEHPKLDYFLIEGPMLFDYGEYYPDDDFMFLGVSNSTFKEAVEGSNIAIDQRCLSELSKDPTGGMLWVKKGPGFAQNPYYFISKLSGYEKNLYDDPTSTDDCDFVAMAEEWRDKSIDCFGSFTFMEDPSLSIDDDSAIDHVWEEDVVGRSMSTGGVELQGLSSGTKQVYFIPDDLATALANLLAKGHAVGLNDQDDLVTDHGTTDSEGNEVYPTWSAGLIDELLSVLYRAVRQSSRGAPVTSYGHGNAIEAVGQVVLSHMTDKNANPDAKAMISTVLGTGMFAAKLKDPTVV